MKFDNLNRNRTAIGESENQNDIVLNSSIFRNTEKGGNV